MSEHTEQAQLVSWFRKNHEERIFAIPNGGGRTKADGIKLKVEGVSAGVPDLYIPEWKLWIEMKRADGGSISKVQKDWIDYLRSIGDTVHVCHGFEKAKQVIEEFRNEQ